MSGISYLIKEGFRSIWNNRTMSLASIGVLFSCLILTGAASLLTMNGSAAAEKIGNGNMTTIRLNESVTTLQAISIGQEIEKIPNVETCTFYSKEEAIEALFNSDELGAAYEYVQGDDNPLPHAFKVSMTDIALYDETITKIMDIPETESYDNLADVAEKLTQFNSLISTLSFWIILALSLISLFIISNTIRATMYARRFEISIMKSVGATNAFVRIPFIVEGMFIGLLSAIISIFGLMFLYDILIQIIQSVIPFDIIPYSEVSGGIALSFIASGMAIGALGASFSISRYLKKEGNEILGW